MNQLPQSTIRLLTSTQAVTGVNSIVKELLENSVDANASSVEIKLENFGLDRIEVKDNGAGVSVSDIPYMAKKHYTSKISNHTDMGSLQTLGFRGEALGAIAAVSELDIITRCPGEKVGRSYKMDFKGDIIKETNLPTTVGTSVVVSKLYKNIPVRRQFYSAPKKKKDELKSVIDLLMSYGIVCYNTRLVLKHEKSIIWQKPTMTSLLSALSHVITPSITSHLFNHRLSLSEDTFLDMHIVKQESVDVESLYRTNADRLYLYVNTRPVTDKAIEKLLRAYLCKAKSNKYPTCYLHLTVPAGDVDVNLEPNKTKVLLVSKDDILAQLEKYLEELYGSLEKQPKTPTKKAPIATANTPHEISEIEDGNVESSIQTQPQFDIGGLSGMVSTPTEVPAECMAKESKMNDTTLNLPGQHIERYHDSSEVSDNNSQPKTCDQTESASINNTDTAQPAPAHIATVSVSSDSEIESDTDVFSRRPPHISVSQLCGNLASSKTTDTTTISRLGGNIASRKEADTIIVRGVSTQSQSRNESAEESSPTITAVIDNSHHCNELNTDMSDKDSALVTFTADQTSESTVMSNQVFGEDNDRLVSDNTQGGTAISTEASEEVTKVCMEETTPALTEDDAEFFNTFILSSSDDEGEIPLFPVDDQAAVNTPTTECNGNGSVQSEKPATSKFKHWSFVTDNSNLTGIPPTPETQPRTSTQKDPHGQFTESNLRRETVRTDIQTENDDLMVLGTSVCNLYNSQSVCQQSTPVKQTQLTNFYNKLTDTQSEELQAQSAQKVNTELGGQGDERSDMLDGVDWARGQLLDGDEPVVLARPPVLQQTTLNHYTEPSDPGQSKRRAVQGSNSIHSEGASMIREETIPDEYRKFIKPSTKKRRVTEAYRDTNQPSINESLSRSSLGCLKPSQRTDLCRTAQYSLHKLKAQYATRLNVTDDERNSSSDRLTYCGTPRTTSGAVVLQGDRLYALNLYRYKEIGLYESLIQEYSIESTPLNTPITLSDEALTDEGWASLTSLPTDSEGTVSHPALTMNGFTVSTSSVNIPDNNVTPCDQPQPESPRRYAITAVSKVIPGYGYIADLKDILCNITSPPAYFNTPVFRHPKVLHHIQSEVVRKIRDMDSLSKDDVVSLINKLNVSSSISTIGTIKCQIHSQPLTTELCRLPAAVVS